MTVGQKAWTRRHVLAGLAAGAAAGVPAAAKAQLDLLLEGLGVKEEMRERGIDVDPDRVLSGAKTIFEGLTLSEEDEIRIGQKLYPRLVARSGGPCRNRRVQSAMRQLFQPLLAGTNRRHLGWEITVVNDDTVNAWALPGGKIAVNKGLLRYVDSEDEVAGVIAHEMGHVEFGHAINEMRTNKFMEGISEIGREVIATKTRRMGSAGLLTEEAIDQLAGPMHDMVMSGYSRSSEHEADRHILTIFQTTGHDPAKAVNIFSTLLQIIPEDTGYTTSLFSTHPGTRERIDAILAAARSMPPRQPRRPDPAYAVLKASFPTRQVYKRRV